MIYLASPYSDPDSTVRQERFHAVCQHAAAMMREGLLVYSPVCHGHALAGHGLPLDWTFWSAHNLRMLRACSTLAVLPLEGWQESEGVRAEIQAARELELPVEVVEPKGMCAETS